MKDTLLKLRQQLVPLYGRGEANAMIRLIFRHLKGWSQVDMIVNEDKPLSDFTKSQIDKILERLLKGEPIQYITGETEFYGLHLHVEPGVLIPRPETEQLVDLIVQRYKDTPDLNVADLGTGSGAIAIALARNLPFARVTAVDLSAEALKVAADNAKKLHAAVRFMEADIFRLELPADSLDILVSNPPYVTESEKTGMEPNVLQHEPAQALFVPDDDPLIYYRRIALIGMEALKPGGTLWFEINARFAAELQAMLKSNGFCEVEILRDSFGQQRFISAVKPTCVP